MLSKGAFLIPVLPVKGGQAAHRDLKQWRAAGGYGHGCHQPLLEGLCREGQAALLGGQHGNTCLNRKAVFSGEVTSGDHNERV